jgi:hypothetical protein
MVNNLSKAPCGALFLYLHLKMKRLLQAFIFMSAIGATKAQAQQLRNGVPFLNIIESLQLKPAVGNGNKVDYRFVAVWQAKESPSYFFWRNATGSWLDCRVAKITTEGVAKPKNSKKIDWYKAIEVQLDEIKKGDTIELAPTYGGRYPIPPEIPANAKNTIFFRTTTSMWLQAPVKKLVKK